MNVFCVRADFGTYAKSFVAGGYVAIGWMPKTDLSAIATRDELNPLYKAEHPDDASNIVVGQQVGQIARFLLEMKPGDYVITPAADTELLHYRAARRQILAIHSRQETTAVHTDIDGAWSGPQRP